MKGTIIRINHGIGKVKGDDGKNYKFNRKTRFLSGNADAAQRFQRIEFEPDGSWISNVKLLNEFQKTEPSPDTQEFSQKEKYRFLNPYNFVRNIENPRPSGELFGNAPPIPHDRYTGLSGKINCTLENTTPLFIADSHAIEGKPGEHRLFQFFKVWDEDNNLVEAIPATSLRGMVRSVFEAVTNSCYGVFDAERQLEYRKETRYALSLKAGRVISLPDKKKGIPGKIQLQKVAKVGAYYSGGKSNRNQLNKAWKNGDRVWARISKGRSPRAWQLAKDRKDIEPGGEKNQVVEGYLKITGRNIPTKKNEYLFYQNSGDVSFITEVMDEYNTVTRGQIEAKRLEIYPQEKLSKDDLVWVEVRDGEAIRICNVRIPRVQYVKQLKEFLPKHLLHCKEHQSLCPACRAFGWVYQPASEEATEDMPEIAAYAGRVRFSHAMLEKNNGYFDDLTLAILSSPKPTTTQFYLMDAKGNADNPKVDYNTHAAKLRGRKFYRHQKQADPGEYTRAPKDGNPQKDDHNRTVQGALKPGAHFSFTLEFENFQPEELGALLFALKLEDGLHHRLGYAKPLGFGSVQIALDKLSWLDWATRLKTLEPKDGEINLDPNKFENLIDQYQKKMETFYGENYKLVLEDMRALLSDLVDLPIHYPRPSKAPDPDGKNFEWFVGNKREGGNAGPHLTLPHAQEDNEGLPLVDKFGRILD